MNTITLSPSILRNEFSLVRLGLVGLEVEKLRSGQVVEEIGSDARDGLRITDYETDSYRETHTAHRATTSWFKRVLSILLIGVSLTLAGVLFGPKLYSMVVPAKTVPMETATDGTPLGGEFEVGSQAEEFVTEDEEPERYLPPQQDSLPEGDWLVIPRIGVRTQLQRTENEEEALDTGVWWVPDFGIPGDLRLPMIVVSHRFGYKWWWQDDYWKYHSFYLLPELEPGDTVEVISDQRKWIYEVYAGEEGTDITDYDADMILYTCKYLNADVRYFRYARLINLDSDSQSL